MKEPAFTIGIEEEYLLVDRETRGLADDPPTAMLDECEKRCKGQVSPEFMRSQIEVGTRVCRNIREARRDLSRLRRVITDVADEHGLAPIASSTHPFSRWTDQKHTPKTRYQALATEMQAAARRLLICGMHVHVGIEDDAMRIDLMSQMSYFLPHLLALSCSSPFWEGKDTGLASYRLTVFDALPRTGLPDQLHSWSEYRRLADQLIAAGCIEDATRIWWDVRPSDKFPTLEQRVTDVCSRVRDAGAIAAVYQCLLAYLFRLRSRNQRWRLYPTTLVAETRW